MKVVSAIAFSSIVAVAGLALSPIAANAVQKDKGVPPAKALEKLVEGNKRFVAGKPKGPNRTAQRRAAVAQTQTPFAVIVTCADSRLTPEFIFDQGIGDLFVVRAAGNTLDKVALGSVEFAVTALGANLIVVMGHERCGAVDAALKGGQLPGNLPAVVAPIQPACEHVTGSDALAVATRNNVKNMVELLAKQNATTKALVDAKKLNVVGMDYDLDTGKATLVK